MKKDELWMLIQEKERQVAKARRGRAIKTIFGYAVMIFILLYWINEPSGFEILGGFLAAIILSGILFMINATVFYHLVTMSEAEKRMLNDLKKQLSELE